MKKWFVSFFAMIVICSCESKQTSPQQVESTVTESSNSSTDEQKKESKKTILFFGDSLTAGYQLNEEESFPSLIQNKINEAGLAYNVVNAGLSGETSSGGKNRIDWVLRQPIDVFVLELGANDALRGLELKSAKSNLESILKSVEKKYPDAKLVIAGMMAPPNLGDEYTREFNKMFPDLAKAYNAKLIPFLLDGVAGNPELNLQDGIHPNVEGQKIVAQNVWKVLEGLL